MALAVLFAQGNHFSGLVFKKNRLQKLGIIHRFDLNIHSLQIINGGFSYFMTLRQFY